MKKEDIILEMFYINYHDPFGYLQLDQFIDRVRSTNYQLLLNDLYAIRSFFNKYKDQVVIA